MDSLRTSVFVLFVLLVPVSSKGDIAQFSHVPRYVAIFHPMLLNGYPIYFNDPVICYVLDAFLVIYCIVATALFFREKFSPIPNAAIRAAGEEGIYQELERPKDADPYQVLEPSKEKKKAGRKKKPESTPEAAAEEDKETTESLIPNGSNPPPVTAN